MYGFRHPLMALTLRRLKSDASDFDQRLASLLNRTGEMDGEVDSTVGAIIQRVRANGDAALLSLTQEFDGLKIDEASALEIPRATWSAAKDRIDPTIQNALCDAARRIREFHEQQKEESWQITQSDGTRLGQQVTPLDRVGIYVPGGKASYPSSVLMNAIPAKVAGVGEIIMVVPTPNGEISDTVLACAELAGVDRMFRIGGAQAIAALAYGTQTVPRVDKIVGPGNRYVAAAKKTGLWRCGHRYDRGAFGSGRRLRCKRAARLGSNGSLCPGRARRTGPINRHLYRPARRRPAGSANPSCASPVGASRDRNRIA